MPEILRSRNGRYLAADQEDGNFVVYLADTMTPIWGSMQYEAGHEVILPPASEPPVPPAPTVPIPAVGAGRVIRVTDERDGELLPRMYSYWSNAVIIGLHAFVFVGHAGGSPKFFDVDLVTGTVVRLGSPLPYLSEGEGWYWNIEGSLYLLEGPRLRIGNPFTGDDRVVFDISETHPGCRLWQAHSSDDGRVHSATVERIVSDGPYPRLGTVVVYEGRQMFFPGDGALDESQVDRGGEFLIIKEGDDNRIITLRSRETRRLSDADGAVGHSDCGDGFVVGEDNQHGACVLWDLRQPLTPGNRRTLFSTWNMGHVSVRGDRCLLSDGTHLSLVALDGSGVTPLLEHGMTGGGYDAQVKANLDPSGRVATYMSNVAGRLDVYLVRLP